jgi:hypothetical protein
MIFLKKGLCTKGAETRLGKKLIWPPQKILSSPLAYRKRVRLFRRLDAYHPISLRDGMIAGQADDPKNHWASIT